MGVRTASLPMYNLPEMQAANGAFWQALARALRRARGDRRAGAVGLRAKGRAGRNRRGGRCSPRPAAIRCRRSITGSTSCSACRITTRRAAGSRRIGRSCWRAQDSGIATSPRTCAAAVSRSNSRHSNSGMNLPRLLFARERRGRPLFREIIETGGHPASLAAVVDGEADAASIDCLTYAFFATIGRRRWRAAYRRRDGREPGDPVRHRGRTRRPTRSRR